MVKALAFVLSLFGQSDSVPIYQMPEIVVTATRLSLPAELSPWPVEVLGVKPDENTDLGKALSPSVSSDVRSYGYEGHSAFGFLGGVSSARVLILSNGVHMNSRRDGVIDLSLLPLAPGDRIEIVKGPLSALYGSSAVGGVINVIPSHKDMLAARLELTDQLGFNTGARATHNFGILGASASGSYLTNPGFRHNDDVVRYHGAGAIWVDPNPKHHIELETEYTFREMGVPGPAPDTSDSAFTPPTFGDSLVTSLYDREEDKLLKVNLSSTFTPNSKYSHMLNIYYIIQDFNYVWPFLNESGDRALDTSDYRNIRAGGDFQIAVDITDFLIWTSGIMLESEKIMKTVEGTDNHMGIWTELLAPLGMFTPSAAARLEYSEQYGPFISPELGLSFVPIPQKLRFSAAYGRSFHTPTLNDLFWPYDGYSEGNPDLLPEKAQSAVLSAEAILLESLRFNASGYWKEVDDMISWLPFNGGLWRPQNVDNVTIWGAEFSTAWWIKPGVLSGSVGVAYNHAVEERTIVIYDDSWGSGEVRTDTVQRQAAIIPPLSLKGNLSLKAWSGGEVTAYATWTGQRVNYYPDYSSYPDVGVTEKTISPSLKIDLAVSQKFLRFLKLEVGLKNLLNDQTPAHFGNATDLDYPTAPRRFYAGLSATY